MKRERKILWVKPETHKELIKACKQRGITVDELINLLFKRLIKN